MTSRKILLTIQYDGADYHGWQIQPGRRTIQGELSDAATSLVGRKITVHGASRTDAGVSALGQVGLFEILNCPIPTENFLKAINDRLPDDIAVTKVSEASSDFDLVGAVTSKLYRYTIYMGEFRPVLDVRHCWHIPDKLNVEAMNTAAQYLIGKHDFKSFASAKDNRDSSVRTISRCDVNISSVIPATALSFSVSLPRRSDSVSRRRVIPASPSVIPASPSVIPAQFIRRGGAGIQSTQYTERRTQNAWLYIDIEGDGFLYNMVRNIAGSLVETGLGRWQPEKMKQVLNARDRTAAGPIAPPQGLCLMWIKY